MKFLVVDDHPLVRRAMGLTLDHVASDPMVLEAESVASALTILAAHDDISLVLLDLFMPGSNGLDGIDRIRDACTAPLAVISADEDPQTAIDALARGASGFLPKSLNEDVMRAAIGLILAGGVYVPPQVTQATSRPNGAGGFGGGNGSATRAGGATNRSGVGGDSLTPRQREVLDLVVEGMSNREIAERLELAEATVKVHITAILRAYGVNSRAKAISAARREAEAP